MATETLTITLDPTSELALALADAGVNEHVVIESNGVRYTVAPEDPLAKYDPQAAAEALRALQGIFEGVDVEQLLRDLREQRGQVCSERSA